MVEGSKSNRPDAALRCSAAVNKSIDPPTIIYISYISYFSSLALQELEVRRPKGIHFVIYIRVLQEETIPSTARSSSHGSIHGQFIDGQSLDTIRFVVAI